MLLMFQPLCRWLSASLPMVLSARVCHVFVGAHCQGLSRHIRWDKHELFSVSQFAHFSALADDNPGIASVEPYIDFRFLWIKLESNNCSANVHTVPIAVVSSRAYLSRPTLLLQRRTCIQSHCRVVQRNLEHPGNCILKHKAPLSLLKCGRGTGQLWSNSGPSFVVSGLALATLLAKLGRLTRPKPGHL